MKYRPLGTSGLVVSEIGFGAWGIGGIGKGSVAYGRVDDRESLLALQLAFELGITFYDTSDFYGFGHSETLIGKAFQGIREKLIFATKGGLLSKEGGQDFSATYIRQAVDRSLMRLRTDYIDLYQLHSPSFETLKERPETFVALLDLVQAGKIRAVGLAARSPQEALRVVQTFNFQVLQVNYNLVDQRAKVDGLFDFCQEKGIGVIARTPLCFGFLTGEYPPETIQDPQDHRSRWPIQQRKKWHEASQLFQEAFEDGKGQSRGQLAIRFCLSHPAVSTVIPGMLQRREVQENAAASEMGWLQASELKKVETIYHKNNFFIERKNA